MPRKIRLTPAQVDFINRYFSKNLIEMKDITNLKLSAKRKVIGALIERCLLFDLGNDSFCPSLIGCRVYKIVTKGFEEKKTPNQIINTVFLMIDIF